MFSKNPIQRNDEIHAAMKSRIKFAKNQLIEAQKVWEVSNEGSDFENVWMFQEIVKDLEFGLKVWESRHTISMSISEIVSMDSEFFALEA